MKPVNGNDPVLIDTANLDQDDRNVEVDEFGTVIQKKKVYSMIELAQMQAIYPENLLFTYSQIYHGVSILYLIGKFIESLIRLLLRHNLLLFWDSNGNVELH
jgi:hypothetical protein